MFQRLADFFFSAHGKQRVAGNYNQSFDGLAVVNNKVWQQVARQCAPYGTQLAVFTVKENIVAQIGIEGTRLGGRVETQRIQIAAGLIQIAGNKAQHLQQPITQGALAPHIHTGRHMHAGRFRGGKCQCGGANFFGGNTHHIGNGFGTVGLNKFPQAVDMVAVLGNNLLIKAGAFVDFV